MAVFRNTHPHARTWPALSVDGHTLHLEAGATTELDVPDDFDDPWLRPVKGRSQASATPDTPTPATKTQKASGAADTTKEQ